MNFKRLPEGMDCIDQSDALRKHCSAYQRREETSRDEMTRRMTYANRRKSSKSLCTPSIYLHLHITVRQDDQSSSRSFYFKLIQLARPASSYMPDINISK
jgi:hypothetical protein